MHFQTPLPYYCLQLLSASSLKLSFIGSTLQNSFIFILTSINQRRICWRGTHCPAHTDAIRSLWTSFHRWPLPILRSTQDLVTFSSSEICGCILSLPYRDNLMRKPTCRKCAISQYELSLEFTDHAGNIPWISLIGKHSFDMIVPAILHYSAKTFYDWRHQNTSLNHVLVHMPHTCNVIQGTQAIW